MAEIFSRLASMPRSEIMKPNSMPLGAPKTHFLGLSLMSFAQSFAKVCSRSAMSWSACLDFDYNVINVGLNGPPDESPKHFSIQRWYVAPMFFRPNGIVT